MLLSCEHKLFKSYWSISSGFWDEGRPGGKWRVWGEKKKQTAVNIMKGKQWNCVARAQKLAFEAHFRILLLNYNLSAMDGR